VAQEQGWNLLIAPNQEQDVKVTSYHLLSVISAEQYVLPGQAICAPGGKIAFGCKQLTPHVDRL
jgi:hypothetical protein